MRIRRDRTAPRGQVSAETWRRRLFAVLCIVLGTADAIGRMWLNWQTPHCRATAAHAHDSPLVRAQCERSASANVATNAS